MILKIIKYINIPPPRIKNISFFSDIKSPIKSRAIADNDK
jgi:hypothetical protein